MKINFENEKDFEYFFKDASLKVHLPVLCLKY